MEYASKGMAGAGLGLGITGTALGLLNGGTNLLGMHTANTGNGVCSENQYVNRYEMTMAQELAARMARSLCWSPRSTPTASWWTSTRT